MTYMTVKEASEKWNISTRRVCVLCSNGQVPGAVKKSKVWMIPTGARKPEDGRKNEKSTNFNSNVLILNPTYIKANSGRYSKEERIICEAQEAFLKGDFEEALGGISHLLDKSENNQYLFVATVLKTLFLADMGRKDEYLATLQEAAMLAGTKDKYKNANVIYQTFIGQEQGSLFYSLMNEEGYEELMPFLSLLNAKKSINELIHGKEHADIINFEIICRELEEKDCPLISAYYHIFLAVYYNAMSEDENYKRHMERAVQILLPRKWYMPIAEYSTTVNLDFIKDIDEEAYKCIIALSEEIIANYIRIGVFASVYSHPRMEVNLNVRIGFKIIQGKSNARIAEELGISQYKVKQHIDDLIAVFGVTTRKEIRECLLASFFV